MLTKIEVTKEFGYPELCDRLNRVGLKGFPDVKIYASARKEIRAFRREIREILSTPQPSVYLSFVERIMAMSVLFAQKGVDIFRLNGGVDYTAFDEKGQATDWTIIPPVVEVLPVYFDAGGIDYNQTIGESLKRAMTEKGHSINPETRNPELSIGRARGFSDVALICDGSHRIHSAYLNELEQNLLLIHGPEKGYPYYAAPQSYKNVQVFAERPPEGTKGKIHVLTEPGHKLLYRLFPSGGILSGDVRPEKAAK